MATNFSKFGIDKELINLLEVNKITKPTPIQAEAIPAILKGNDVIAQAQTGTGKTLAFILPIMERINANNSNVQALIVTPTRELAIQITNEVKKYMSAKGVNILAAYGGQDVERQVKKLKGDIHIVIGTPGRLLDHLRRGTINLGKLKMFVLDEADQMLHMGFLNDIEDIIYKTPKQRQNMFFSATMTKQVRSLATKYMKNPVQIQIQSTKITLDEIKQIVIETTDRKKQDALCKTLDEHRPFMAIIFCRTKRRVKKLSTDLKQLGYNTDELHGDLSQAKREKVMKDFRKMKIQYLVATDVAARGLDIEGITHIFNYDIPEDVESYIHRIGRTGRAGETGVAVTFVAPKDMQALEVIEKRIKMTINKQKLENKNRESNDKTNRKSDKIRDYKSKGKDNDSDKKDYGNKKPSKNKKIVKGVKKNQGKNKKNKFKKSDSGKSDRNFKDSGNKYSKGSKYKK